MKAKAILILLGLLLSIPSSCQDKQKYSELINTAFRLYQNKDYLESGKMYSEAFNSFRFQVSINDRLVAACAYSLAKVPDSAFVQLYELGKDSNFIYYNHLLITPDLENLQSDNRWNELINIVRANNFKLNPRLDKSLVAILDTVEQDDQKYRLQLNDIEKKYGLESKELESLWKLILEKDSINIIKVTKVLDEYGWLGPTKIGIMGNSTLFYVIQHSDLNTQEKYLPMMREAVKKGDATPNNLAYLEDRVALRHGKKQIYGSQIGRDEITGEYYVRPLEDPDKVDIRREAVGLGKLQDYISNYGLTWNPEEYEKKLPEIEAKEIK